MATQTWLPSFRRGRGRLLLHPLRHFNTQESHTVAKGLGNVASDDETHGLRSFALGIEDAVVVVELIELLRQLIAVVGDAGGRIVLASLLNGSGELIQLLDESRLLSD